MTVKDIMTEKVELIKPDATLQEAAQKMRKGDFGILPVQENDQIIGVVTDRDICIRGVADAVDAKTISVREVMTKKVYYCYEDDETEKVADLMAEDKVRRFPVMNRDKQLVGIVSLADMATSPSASHRAEDQASHRIH